jgi:hypothetical protein
VFIVATIGLIPLGPGSFELVCAELLASQAARLETVLTVMLLSRGFYHQASHYSATAADPA